MVARLSPQTNCYLDSIAGTVDVVLSFTVPPPSSDNPVVAFPKEYFSERASIDQDLLQAAWTAVHDYIYLKLRELGAKNHFWSSLGDAETDIVSVEIDAEDFKSSCLNFRSMLTKFGPAKLLTKTALRSTSGVLAALKANR